MKKVYNYVGYLVLTLIILNILDTLTTLVGLKLGCYEGNVLMRNIVNKPIALMTIKISVPLILATRLANAYKQCTGKMKKRILGGLRIINVYYVLVVISNIVSIGIMLAQKSS